MRLGVHRRHPDDNRRAIRVGAGYLSAIAGNGALNGLRIEPSDVAVENHTTVNTLMASCDAAG